MFIAFEILCIVLIGIGIWLNRRAHKRCDNYFNKHGIDVDEEIILTYKMVLGANYQSKNLYIYSEANDTLYTIPFREIREVKPSQSKKGEILLCTVSQKFKHPISGLEISGVGIPTGNDSSIYSKVCKLLEKAENIDKNDVEAAYARVKPDNQLLEIAETVTVSQATGFDLLSSYKYYAWIEKNILSLFPVSKERALFRTFEDKIHVTAIPLDDIIHFCKDGEIFHEQIISGGGGGGSSLKGAVIGGIIAGEAGAIIGSRKETEAITSRTVTHDTRCVLLKVKSGEIKFNSNDYDVFAKLIPEKEYQVIEELRRRSAIDSATKTESATKENAASERIKSLNELKNAGLITDDEYKEKRAEILSSL